MIDNYYSAQSSEVVPPPTEAARKVNKFKDGFDREIRIFISSPFKDMQEERDQLVHISLIFTNFY